MNKKLLTGIFGFGISVLLFVACGSGDIVPTTSDDTAEFLEKQEEYSDQSKRDQIIEACLLDPECDDELMNPSSAVEPSSSSTIPPLESSSSAATPVSSSSGTTQPNSSSAVTPVSSSSGTTQPGSSSSTQTGGVTCAPTPLTISKGGEATWKVEGLGGAALTTHFDWSFPDGNPATVTGGATTAFSPKVTYGTSGSKTATLTYNYDNVITCSPLQVNGAPITGSCTANSLQVDVALGETITYTMTAASTGAKITGYTWTKAAGTSNTATFTPAEKGDVTGVSVKVANDDNTVQSFDCPSVKAIDSSSPDYELTAPDTKITIPAGNVIIAMNLPANWHNGTEGTCTFACNADGVFSGTVNGNATISGEWYATTKIPITSTINGYALSVTLDKPATCQIGW